MQFELLMIHALAGVICAGVTATVERRGWQNGVALAELGLAVLVALALGGVLRFQGLANAVFALILLGACGWIALLVGVRSRTATVAAAIGSWVFVVLLVVEGGWL